LFWERFFEREGEQKPEEPYKLVGFEELSPETEEVYREEIKKAKCPNSGPPEPGPRLKVKKLF
jgi:hypothetical protein